MTPRQSAPAPRNRPHIKAPRRARMRVTVYRRDDWKCRSCGWKPNPPPEGYGAYDGSYALYRVMPVAVSAQHPDGLATWRLELDHVIPWWLGGAFILANLQALCTLCNTRKDRRRRQERGPR